MLFVFVVDTSASMLQRTTTGMSLLDCSKAAIETFVRVRAQHRNVDRFLLVDFDGTSAAVKGGWSDSNAHFMDQVRNLQARHTSGVGQALVHAFNALNRHRFQASTDSFGQGRYPGHSDPAVILLLTDGGQMTSASGIEEKLSLPVTPIPGYELVREPFRWDQRLFSIIMRFNGMGFQSDQHQQTGLQLMSEVTGGRCQFPVSLRTLSQSVESLAGRMPRSVVVNLEVLPLPGADRNSHQRFMYLVLLPKAGPSSSWPIPEAYVPDGNMNMLPARSAHPLIRVAPADAHAGLLDRFPFDRYDLEPCATHSLVNIPGSAPTYTKCALLALMKSCKQGFCWQIFVSGSASTPQAERPFGYIKVNRQGTGVSLFLLPYNYPKLFGLLDRLHKELRMQPNGQWKAEFEHYIRAIPQYYVAPLRSALRAYGIANVGAIIPDNMGNELSVSPWGQYLRQVKDKFKAEMDRLYPAVAAGSGSRYGSSGGAGAGAGADGPSTNSINIKAPTTDLKGVGSGAGSGAATNFRNVLGSSEPAPWSPQGLDGVAAGGSGGGGGGVGGSGGGGPDDEPDTGGDADDATGDKQQFLRNAFDIPRAQLLQQAEAMRRHVLGISTDQDQDALRSVPIRQMGNYAELLMKQEVLRAVLVDERVQRFQNRPFFGNPFRADKSAARMALVDEADVTEGLAWAGDAPPPGGAGGAGGPGNKRAAPAAAPQARKQARQGGPPPPSPGVGGGAPGSPGSFTSNSDIKVAAIRLIRKPGKNFDVILKTLANTKGDKDTKRNVFRAVAEEAKRFKKHELVGMLEDMIKRAE